METGPNVKFYPLILLNNVSRFVCRFSGGVSHKLTGRSVVHNSAFFLNRSLICLLIVIIISILLWTFFSFRRNWKRRWFVLKDNVLTYHETDMDGAKSLGTIDIRNAVWVKSEHKIYSVAPLIYVLLRTFFPHFHHWYCFAIIFG